jgi:hypothetical protein
MCCKWFKKKPKPPELVLPHPEEPENPAQTAINIDVSAILTKWLSDWQVPVDQWEFWRTQVIIHIDPNYNGKAGAGEYQGKRHIIAHPAWFNPGVVAHEQAHNSYALLSPEQKTDFNIKYTILKTTDPMIVFMLEKHSYGKTNDTEGHAEVYRYIGQQMPELLKEYYPRLL